MWIRNEQIVDICSFGFRGRRMPTRVLLTNDDGYLAPGLSALRREAEKCWDTVVVAPDREQSAASHALTLNRPLRVAAVEDHVMAVDGTPTDCVMLSLRGLLDVKPDIVISGINNGANLGDDVIYSGTVAGAAEAAILGVPAVAVSFVEPAETDFGWGAEVALDVAHALLAYGLPAGVFLNVNIPPRTTVKRFETTCLGKRSYRDVIVRKTDPRGKPYFWIAGQPDQWQGGDNCDFAAIERGAVSITPLQLDMTAFRQCDTLATWTFGGR